MSTDANVDVVRRWVELLGRWGADPSDVSRALDLIHPDCEWVLMATGERFRGTDEIQRMAEKSMSAISHSEAHQLRVTNLFGSGDRVCLEYVHGALLRRPGESKSTEIEMPICIVFHLRDGRIDHAQEYYEVELMKGPGAVKPVYA